MIKLTQLLESSRQIRGEISPRRIPLTEGVKSDKIAQQIAQLEAEWERLDNQGTGHARQMEIQREISKLWSQKEKWDGLYKAAEIPISEEDHPNDYVLLGANWADGTVSYVVSRDMHGRHPSNMLRADNRWRFVPEINYLAWWIKPSEEEKELVMGYLNSKGYRVKNNGAMGYINEEIKKGGDVVFGGIWSNDRIVAYIASDATGYGHTREMGSNRWTYHQDMGSVFWKHTPSDDNKFAVENWLTKRGYTVTSHRQADEYWALAIKMQQDKKKQSLNEKYIDLNENKKLIMEAKQDEAALDFLKQMVRKGPFRGKVYLAGGAVRDMIRGEVPKDLDVVVTDNGVEGGMKFAQWLAQQMGNYKEGSNPVLFPTFGTAKVILTGIHNGVDLDGFDVEAVFARKEVYTPGSRKPEVFPGTIEDDAFRRDFTVNSMMLDLTTDKILDITGHGRSDIAAGLIRTTSNPDEIFGQDALRMFRAIRFATKYKWKIDPATWEGIKKNLDNLSNTSMERVRDELDKILMTSDPAYGIRLLRDSGLLPHVAPELQQAVGMTQNKHHKDDVFDHTMEVLKNTKPELVQRLMALFHDIGKVATREETPTGVHFIGHENVGADVAEKIMRNLKYPLDLINAVKLGVHQHMRLKHGKDEATMSDSTLRKFKIALGDNLEHLLDVIHADNISHADASSMPNQIARVRERLKTLDVQVKKPNLPINGMDLQAIGVKQGPMIGKILGAITDAWYENPNISREESLAIAKSMI